MPIISIIVPVYNAEQYLYQCIDSILAQTFTDFECILVDDCSPDNCANICDEYARIDKRIKVIHNVKNKGSSLSRKIGFEKSCGTYIQFVDSDDWIEKKMIEKLYEKAISENNDITICDCFYEKEGIKTIIKQNFTGFNKTSVIKDVLYNRVKVYLINKLIKRELYFIVEFPEYSHSEDYVITIQNLHNAKKIGYVNLPLYNYRYNEKSLSNNIKEKIVGRVNENRNWCRVIKYLKEKYIDLEIFEPELSHRINSFRNIYMLDNHLKKMKELNELFELYPGKNFYWWKIVERIKNTIRIIIPPNVLVLLKDIRYALSLRLAEKQ